MIPPILAVIDQSLPTEFELERVRWWADYQQAPVVLVSNAYEPIHEISAYIGDSERQRLYDATLSKQADRLQKLCDQLKEDGVEATYHVEWSSRLHQAVEQAQSQFTPQLIIKTINEREDSGLKLFTPTDWHILRHTHCPVLLTRTDHQQVQGPIIAAVQPDNADEKHLALSQRILETGQQLAAQMNTHLHAVNVFPTPLVDAPLYFPNLDLEELRRNHFQRHYRDLKELVADYSVEEDFLHVEEGETAKCIVDVCNRLGASLLLIGSVKRKGLFGMITGNTVEEVLVDIGCDVLCIA